MRLGRIRSVGALCGLLLAHIYTNLAYAEIQLRKIGELELSLLGVSAGVSPLEPVVPKNTPSAIRLIVRAGDRELTAAELEALLGAGIRAEGVLSGPGRSPLRLPALAPGEQAPSDPFLLPFPALSQSGSYTLSGLRLHRDGATVLDVLPDTVPLKVIDDVLITSVKTRPLTMAEIREKGIVLDSDAYLGFEFTLGLKLESSPINFSFPVVFGPSGVPVPLPLAPPPPPLPSGVQLPPMSALLLEIDEPVAGGVSGGENLSLQLPNGAPIRIPSLLVIPGNVGYLKQFFSAQLYVANGAPVGAGLTVRDVTGTIQLPPSDGVGYPDVKNAVQPKTKPVKGVGLDATPETPDDTAIFQAAEQGQAEFLLRGDKEGFHTLSFDIAATLDGLPVGPVKIKGKATGGVLVRNALFDMSFIVPSVVRKGETFRLYVTLTNIGEAAGNRVEVVLDSSQLDPRHEVLESPEAVDIPAGDSRTVSFLIKSGLTGEVTASYLRMGENAGSGALNFRMGVGERGIPLSPDTLVLPAPVRNLDAGLVEAAMRVLGQAWSIANAPTGTLRPGVKRINKSVVGTKALALAEAGLRVELGQSARDAVRDVAFDFWGGRPVDAGFDQLLRTTEAGRELTAAIAGLLAGGSDPHLFDADAAEVAAAGPDFLSFAITGDTAGAVTLSDATNRLLGPPARAEIPGGAVFPFGPGASWGLVTDPSSSTYTLDVPAGALASLTVPKGDGSFARFTGIAGPLHVVVDTTRPEAVTLVADGASDRRAADATISSTGPALLAANIIGPETLNVAGPFGYHVALLFDRAVSDATAKVATNYAVLRGGLPVNTVRGMKRQLSGRIVFGSLEQPEGPYVPVSVAVEGVADGRGVVRPRQELPLVSRIEDPGAVVSGRVLTAEGNPVGDAVVTYENNSDTSCVNPLYTGFSAQRTGSDGRYEMRFVRRDNCGLPFRISTRDPQDGAVRRNTAYVQYSGEQILLDVVLFGRGVVEGVVRSGENGVPGARVSVVSETDPQVGGSTTADGDGRYRVEGITVGPVSVFAASGAQTGRAAGVVARAGTTAVIDVNLTGASVQVSGTVRRIQSGSTADPVPVPGLPVIYYVDFPELQRQVPVGVTTTGADGRYSFRNLLVGSYEIRAYLNTRDGVTVTGDAVPGSVVERDLLIVTPATAELATVSGRVYADGAPAAGVIVAVDGRGVLTDANGDYAVPGVTIRTSSPALVTATSRDGLRTASRTLYVTGPQSGIDLTLSGLGGARFRVVDSQLRPVAGQSVSLVAAGCHSPCGCRFAVTDTDGWVAFSNLRPGTATAKVARLWAGTVDAAQVAVTVTPGVEPPAGELLFKGAGVVAGIVRDPQGQPVFGAEVSLQSVVYIQNDGTVQCADQERLSHRTRTGPDGKFRFGGVRVGLFRLSATQDFFAAGTGASGRLVADGQQLTSFTLQFTDTTAGKLTGTVFLPDGQTPAGRGVRLTLAGLLPDLDVETDDEGRYKFPEIFPEGSYTLTTRDARTGGVAQARLMLRKQQPLEHDVRLLGRGTLRVRVVDAADVPQFPAVVRIRETRFPNNVYEALVDDSNEGVIEVRVFEGPVSLEAFDAVGRGGRASAEVTAPGAPLEVNVRLAATGTVRGRFLMRDQTTPIPYGQVRLFVGSRELGQATTAAGTDIGGFRFDYVPVGSFRIEAQDPLTGRTGVALGRIDVHGEEIDLQVTAQGLGRVSGQVTSNDDPAASAIVKISSGTYDAETRADGQGFYSVDGVPEGPVVVTATDAAAALAATASGNLVDDGGSVTIDVALRAWGSVRGRVVSPPPTSTGRLSTVSVQSKGTGGGRQSMRTSASGDFLFTRVPAGTATLTADVLDTTDVGVAEAVVPEGAEAVQDIVLNGLGSVEVFVHRGDAGGSPFTTASVSLRSATIARSGSVDSQGRLFLSSVPAGTYTVDATSPTGLKSPSQEVQVGDGAVPTVHLTMPEAASVSGVVFHHGGTAPAAGATVTLTRGPTFAGNRTTGADGRFSFADVPLGAFKLSATKPSPDGMQSDRGLASGTLTAAADPVDITLNGLGALEVPVVDALGAIVPGATVQVTVVSPFLSGVNGATGADGLVTFPYLLAGQGTVSAHDPVRGVGGTADVNVVAGITTRIAVTLAPVGSIAGVVYQPDGATPAGGVEVAASNRKMVTGADGAYFLDNLPVSVGAYVVYARTHGVIRAQRTVTLGSQSPAVTGADLRMVDVGRVTGTITHQGAVVSGATVSLVDRSFSGSYQVQTDETGKYAIESVFLGTFRVSATHPTKGRAKSAVQTLSANGQTVSVSLALIQEDMTIPVNLRDGNGQQTRVGKNGADTERTPILSLVREGVEGQFTGDTGVGSVVVPSEEDDREPVIEQSILGLDVTRKVYVPVRGYFVRYLETITNSGPDPVTVDVVETVPFTGSTQNVVETSSGDAVLDGADRWIVVDGVSLSSLPFVFVTGDGRRPMSEATFQVTPSGLLSYRWNDVTIAPGASVAIMNLVSRQGDQTRAAQTGKRLSELPPEVLADLTPDEAAAIANFAVPADLVSALAPLPPTGGTIHGQVYAGDGVTPADPSGSVVFKSESPHYWVEISSATNSAGAFTLTESAFATLPRQPFNLTVQHLAAGSHFVNASASGSFAPGPTSDLTAMSVRALSASTTSTPTQDKERAVDGNPTTAWTWANGNSAGPPYLSPPWFEVAFPYEVTVHEIEYRGAPSLGRLDGASTRNLLRVELQVWGASSRLWSTTVDLQAHLPYGDVVVQVPAVAGARRVRLVSAQDQALSPGFGDLLVRGEGLQEPTRVATQDVVFTGAGLLEGRVTMGGEPYSDANLRIIDGLQSQSTAIEAGTGFFRYPILGPKETYVLEARLTNGITRSATVAITAGQKTTQNLDFPATGTLAVNVRSATQTTGSFSAAVTVTNISSPADSPAVRSVAITNKVGTETFALLPAGTYSVNVNDGHSAAVVPDQTVTIAAGATSTLDFNLPPVGTVNVHVTEGGADVQGAAVSWQSNDIGPAFTAAGVTNASGIRGITGVPGAFTVRVEYPGSTVLYKDVTGVVETEGQSLTVGVDLTPETIAGTVTGFVRELDGSPRASRTVEILSGGQIVGTVTTAADGRYTYDLVPVGPVRVRTTVTSGSPLAREVEIPAVGTVVTADLDLPGALVAGGDRHVFLTDVVGGTSTTFSIAGTSLGSVAALSGRQVSVATPLGAVLGPSSSITIPSPSTGRYAITVHATSNNVGGYRLTVRNNSTSDTYDVLRPEGRVFGVVTRSDTGAGVAGHLVRVSVPTAGAVITSRTAANGTYEVSGLPDGAGTVSVIDNDGGVLAQAPVTVDANVPAEQDLEILPRGTVTVTVTRGVGFLTGTVVTFVNPTAPAGDQQRQKATDGGQATVQMPAGPITVSATDGGVTREASGTLEADGSLSLSLAFDDTGRTVSGVIRALDNVSPLPGAEVRLGALGPARTGADGSYSFTGLSAGTYLLSVTFETGASWNQSVTVGTLDVVVPAIRLLVPILEGHVLEPDGAGAEGAVVTACSGSCRDSLPTGADGSYLLYLGYSGFVSPITARLTDGSSLSVSGTPYNPNVFPRRTIDFTLPVTASIRGVVVPGVAGLSVQFRAPFFAPRSTTTGEGGTFRFDHIRTSGAAVSVSVYAEGQDGAPGRADGTVADGQTLDVTLNLSPMGTVSGRLLDGAAALGLPGRTLRIQALEAPTAPVAFGQAALPWTREVTTAVDAGSEGAFSLAVPAGLFRIVFEGEPDYPEGPFSGAAAAEGVLAGGGIQDAILLVKGSHVLLPQEISGPSGSYRICWTHCDEDDRGFSLEVAGAEPYPNVVASEARGVRSLQVAGSGVRARQLQYVPPSGAFTRILALFTNPGDSPATVNISSRGVFGSPTQTSSGDDEATVTDTWAESALEEEGREAIVWGGALTPSRVVFNPAQYGEDFRPSNLDIGYTLTLAPQETRALVLFVIRRPGDPEADLSAQIAALSDLTDPYALAGLSAFERAAIANFTLPTAAATATGYLRDELGAPLVGWTVQVRQGASGDAVVTQAPDGRFQASLFANAPFTAEAVDAWGMVVARREGAEPGVDADLTVPSRELVQLAVTRGGMILTDVVATISSDHATALGEDKTRVRLTDGAGVARTVLPVGTITVAVADPASGATHLRSGSLSVGSPLSFAVDLDPEVDSGTLTLHGIQEGTLADAGGALVWLGVEGHPEASGWVRLDGVGQATVVGLPPSRVEALVNDGTLGLGWAEGYVTAGGTLDLTVRIGQRSWLPINLAGGDGVPYWLFSNGGLGGQSDDSCTPFCGTYVGTGEHWLPDQFARSPIGRLLQGGREVEIGSWTSPEGLRLTRRVFVPPAGGFARIIDVLENTNGSETVADYGSEAWARDAWSDVATDGGEVGTFEVADTYVVAGRTDGAQGEILYILHGPGGTAPGATEAAAEDGRLGWLSWWPEVTIPPGEKRLFLQFLAWRPSADFGAAVQQAEALRDLTATNALTGLTAAEKERVVNFQVMP